MSHRDTHTKKRQTGAFTEGQEIQICTDADISFHFLRVSEDHFHLYILLLKSTSGQLMEEITVQMQKPKYLLAELGDHHSTQFSEGVVLGIV